MADWRVVRTRTGTVEPALVDATLTDAYNRFARSATLTLRDPDSTKASEYDTFEPARVDVKPSNRDTWIQRLAGFSVNPQRTGPRELTVEVLSHDFWLRRRPVFRTVSNAKISTVLENLVKDLTPLTWSSQFVTVQNDRTVSREWRGERLDEVIQELSSISADEQFGAKTIRDPPDQLVWGEDPGHWGDPELNGGGVWGDDALRDEVVFFFEPAGADPAPRDFTEGKYTYARFEEDGKQQVNRVTLFYGASGSRASVQVDDREAQKDLADKNGVSSPVVIEVTRTFEEIDNEEAAERKARQILNEGLTIQTGTLQTWAGWDLRPGQVSRVEASKWGVDADFRIAEIEHQRNGQTQLILAENTEGVVDVLVGLSNEITRVDSRAADPTTTATQFLDSEIPVEIQLSLTMDKIPIPDEQLVWGENKGAWGDPDVGGGKWGDNSGDKEELVSI